MPTALLAYPVPQLDRKTAILAAALDVFTEKGVEAATIDDIRQRANASVGSIYHHFGTKEGIAATLFAEALDDYWAHLLSRTSVAGHARGAIEGLIAAHLGWIVVNSRTARFMFTRSQAISGEYEQMIRKRTGAHFKQLLAQFKPWLDSGVLRRLPAELYGPLLMGPAQDLARQWLEGRVRGDLVRHASELGAAAWRSLSAE